MMRAINHLFEQRANLSYCQLELQSAWDRNYQRSKKYRPEKRYEQ